MNKKEELMSEIWKTYHPKLQVYLKQVFPNIRDAEDRVSEILLKVFDKLDCYNKKYALSTWIYRIARNSQIDEIRKLTLKNVEFDENTITGENNVENEFIKEYEKESVKKAIETLKPNERELIFLYYYEGLKYKEINNITGIPEGTLKFRMSCSRKKIKSIIERSELYEKQY